MATPTPNLTLDERAAATIIELCNIIVAERLQMTTANTLINNAMIEINKPKSN